MNLLSSSLKALAIVALVGMTSLPAAACFQVGRTVLRLSSGELRGLVTLNGKPLPSTLSLHKTIDTNSQSPSYLLRSLKATAAQSNGRFNFGAVPPGDYWIVMKAPSGEHVHVIVVDSKGHDEVRMAYSFDFCHDYQVDHKG